MQKDYPRAPYTITIKTGRNAGRVKSFPLSPTRFLMAFVPGIMKMDANRKAEHTGMA